MKLIPRERFKKTINEKTIDLFTLKNNNGSVTQITNYGGRIVNFWIKDIHQNYLDIVLGYDTIDDYLNATEAYFGAIIGRYGNRIAKGQFNIGNNEYKLNNNEGENQLHGGDKGFHNAIWDAEQLSNTTLKLSYLSKDKEEGYPGNLKVTVLYSLTNNNELKIEYSATTDKKTHVNLTHHSYFNLNGVKKPRQINDHILQINAKHYTPVNNELIPTGKITKVENTPFDFRAPKPIGKHINEENEQLILGSGYDHNFVLDGNQLKTAAIIKASHSGIAMEVITNEPGLQFYSGNFINVENSGKNNASYSKRAAFCLETQHAPNSPNQSNFPSTILEVNEEYKSMCIYKFTLEKE